LTIGAFANAAQRSDAGTLSVAGGSDVGYRLVVSVGSSLLGSASNAGWQYPPKRDGKVIAGLLGSGTGLVTVYADSGRLTYTSGERCSNAAYPLCLPPVKAIPSSALKQGKPLASF
jgi:hypothetical protein